MRKSLVLLTVLAIICFAGCTTIDSIITGPSESPTDQELISYAKTMVETYAPADNITSYDPDFKIDRNIDGRFFVTGECKYVNTGGKERCAGFVCGMELVEGNLSYFSFDWLDHIDCD